MNANIVTVEDLETFRKKLLDELVSIVSSRIAAPQREWLKSNEVRRVLLISPNSLQTLRDKGYLPYTKIEGIYYYSYADVIKMLEHNKIIAPGEIPKLPDDIRVNILKQDKVSQPPASQKISDDIRKKIQKKPQSR